MATYTTSIVVYGAISVSGSGGSVYTAPANGYAIVNAFGTSGVGYVTAGGKIVYYVTGAGPINNTIYLGPGQVLGTTGSLAIDVTGVSFINGG